MAFPLSDRPSRQCTVILADEDLEKLDALCSALGEARSSLMRSFIQMGTELMMDPVNALPMLMDGIIANAEALAALQVDAPATEKAPIQ